MNAREDVLLSDEARVIPRLRGHGRASEDIKGDNTPQSLLRIPQSLLRGRDRGLLRGQCPLLQMKTWKDVEKMIIDYINEKLNRRKSKTRKRKKKYVYSYYYRCSDDIVVIPGYGAFSQPYITSEKRCGYVPYRDYNRAAPMVIDAASRRNIPR